MKFCMPLFFFKNEQELHVAVDTLFIVNQVPDLPKGRVSEHGTHVTHCQTVLESRNFSLI